MGAFSLQISQNVLLYRKIKFNIMQLKEKESHMADLQKSGDQRKNHLTSGENTKKVDPERLRQFLGTKREKKK